MTKEPYIHDRRALYTYNSLIVLYEKPKSPTYMTKEPYIHDKRALYKWQKSPTYMTEEPYIHDKRALHTCDLPHSYMRHDSGGVVNASGSMPCSYACHVSFIHVTCLIHKIHVSCLIHMYDALLIHVSCLIQTCVMSHSYDTRVMSHSYDTMWCASFIRETWLRYCAQCKW